MILTCKDKESTIEYISDKHSESVIINDCDTWYSVCSITVEDLREFIRLIDEGKPIK